MSPLHLEVLNWWFFLAAAVFVCFFVITVSYGVELRREDKDKERHVFLKKEHRWHANGMLWSLVFAVLPIEIIVKLGGFADRSPALFWTHISFVIPFACALLLARFKITGTKNLSLHVAIVRASIALFVCVAVTGSMLFFNIHLF
ncbi:MAG: hypothetical protein HYT28_03130 [Parcubacteria group bacterium]|nr:hypothetical protein [Parcubacteria group bacterium]